MSALVLEDYFKPFVKNELTERESSIIMRGTVLVLGALSVALVYVVEHLGAVLQLSMSVPATCMGSLFGVFIIGMFIPWIGRRAAFYGALMASSVMIYIVIRSQLDIASGLLHYDKKVTSVEGCAYNFTTVIEPSIYKPNEKEFHHVSYLYYMPMGALLTCMSSFVISFLFGFEDPKNIDPKLLAPYIRNYFALKFAKDNQDQRYELIETVISNEKRLTKVLQN